MNKLIAIIGLSAFSINIINGVNGSAEPLIISLFSILYSWLFVSSIVDEIRNSKK